MIGPLMTKSLLPSLRAEGFGFRVRISWRFSRFGLACMMAAGLEEVERVASDGASAAKAGIAKAKNTAQNGVFAFMAELNE